jgi:hypothetical protein
VGRIRQNLVFGDKGLEFFVCGDQLLRGAVPEPCFLNPKSCSCREEKERRERVGGEKGKRKGGDKIEGEGLYASVLVCVVCVCVLYVFVRAHTQCIQPSTDT